MHWHPDEDILVGAQGLPLFLESALEEPSSIARVLAANDPTLRSINAAYRGLADDRRAVLKHLVF